eukprot:1739099-Amphidinium_carterae.1
MQYPRSRCLLILCNGTFLCHLRSLSWTGSRCQAVAGGLARILEGKSLLLSDKLIHLSGHPDKELVADLMRGLDIAASGLESLDGVQQPSLSKSCVNMVCACVEHVLLGNLLLIKSLLPISGQRFSGKCNVGTPDEVIRLLGTDEWVPSLRFAVKQKD